MRCQHLHQLRMHERLAAENAKVSIPMLLGVIDQLVPLIQIDHLPRRFHIHPAPLAAQLAAVDDRNKQKRREMDAVFEAFFEFLHGAHALVAEIKGELPEKPFIGFFQHALGELIDHLHALIQRRGAEAQRNSICYSSLRLRV
jgi:hypothetical protein